MEESCKLLHLPNLALINILYFNDCREFMNLVYSCKKLYKLFEEHPLIFLEYLGMPKSNPQELRTIRRWNLDAKTGYYNDASNRRKAILNLMGQEPRYLDTLGYKVDGGHPCIDGGYK